ncbi:MAG: hypothetical protein KIT31_11285 [Deltaproteobacteria bacterium]|nr:hypothetical protein [Deltaproteobacteria bacterium]
MSRLRLCLASLLLVGACHAGTTTSTFTHTVRAVPPAHPQIELDRAAVRAKLAERRAVVVERFVAYRDLGVYPIEHTLGPGAQHVWIDDAGHLCAVATLIAHDWDRAAVVRAGAKDRQMRMADVTSGPLADWMLTSGLTRAEVVAIQAPTIGEDGRVIAGGFIDPRGVEITRLYTMYLDVERQLRGLWDESLDLATDALIARSPDLARTLLAGRPAGPGGFAKPAST